jgi:hypothetical protein
VVPALALLLAAMYVGPLADFFVLTPLSLAAWATVAVAAFAGLLAGWFLTRLLSFPSLLEHYSCGGQR